MAATELQLIAAARKYAKLGNLANVNRNLDLLETRARSRKVAVATLVEPDLSTDPRVATAQLLAFTGHPIVVDEQGAAHGPTKEAVLADCTPDQNRELALLGFFGTPNEPHPAGVDWSLFERYFAATPAGLTEGGQPTEGNWAPKPEYANTGTWQAYCAGE